MPSDQERSEPTPAEVAASEAWDGIKILGLISREECVAALSPILTRLVEATERAAKREALTAVAKVGCRPCSGEMPRLNKHAQVIEARWVHVLGSYIEFCKRPEVHDALSALESSGEAK